MELKVISEVYMEWDYYCYREDYPYYTEGYKIDIGKIRIDAIWEDNSYHLYLYDREPIYMDNGQPYEVAQSLSTNILIEPTKNLTPDLQQKLDKAAEKLIRKTIKDFKKEVEFFNELSDLLESMV